MLPLRSAPAPPGATALLFLLTLLSTCEAPRTALQLSVAGTIKAAARQETPAMTIKTAVRMVRTCGSPSQRSVSHDLATAQYRFSIDNESTMQIGI